MQLRFLALSLATVGLLSACGGSGDSAPATATPAPAPGGGSSTVTLTGVVATGAAMANAAVSATCATGTGSATTAANGGYTLTVTGGVLPCVLQAGSGSGALRSVAPTGTSTANITPLTELLLAQITGQDPAAYVASLNAGQLAAQITPSSVSAAQSAVVATLTAAGVDTSAIGNFVSGTLVAAVGGSGGNGYDQVLDTLAGTLASAGTTLTSLTSTVAATAGAPSTTTAAGSGDGPSLPADLLLKAKAPNCATLASGRYRIVKQAPSVSSGASDAVTATESVDLDAATLTLASAANASDTWSWTANGNCRYSAADGSDIVVSPAGVVVARAAIGSDDDTVAVSARGSTRLVVALPAQTFTLADLAGTWSYLSWVQNSGSFGGEAATFTVGTNGALTQFKCDADSLATPEASCTSTTTLLPAFTVHADGGFTLSSTDPSEPWSDRVWVYRSGNGELMLVALSPSGELTFATKQRTLSLPTVGDSSTVWNVFANVGAVAADTVSTNTNTTTAVDSAAGSYSRNNSSNGSSVTVPQTVVQNSGRNGYAHRLAATGVTASDGSTSNVRESWFLPLKGFGLTAIYLPNSSAGANSNARFGLSVKQP